MGYKQPNNEFGQVRDTAGETISSERSENLRFAISRMRCETINVLVPCLVLSIGTGLLLVPLEAQTQAHQAATAQSSTVSQVKVDFTSPEIQPSLSKTFVGVYQTPFWFKSHPPDGEDAQRMVKLLNEAGVHDLRYELAWGPPQAS